MTADPARIAGGPIRSEARGLAWQDEPIGFNEKEKIAFAQSQTVPVIHGSGAKVVRIVGRRSAPGRGLSRQSAVQGEAALANASSSELGSATVQPPLFPLVVSDLYDRVRRDRSAYFRRSRAKRLGTADFAAFQKRRGKRAWRNFRAVLRTGSPCPERAIPCRASPAIPRLRVGGAFFLWGMS